ncbi:MAG: AEC family transporter [Caulobacteraceae bacterium]|nr:AEC family transporter [Caulobacteraceae bacterium]
MDIFARVAPFFLLIAVGALAGRLGWLDARRGGWLSAYTFWIGFPALLLRWLGDAPPPGRDEVTSLVGYGVIMGATLVAVWGLGRRLNLPRPAAAGAPMAAVVGNTAFLGAPLAAAVLGEGVRPLAAAVVAVDFILLMGVAVAILQTGAPSLGLGTALRRVLANPTVLGAVGGLAIAAFGLRLPGPADQGLTVLAASASPVALLALGGLIGREGVRVHSGERVALGLVLSVKLALAPLLVWFVLTWLGVDPIARATVTLLAACPTAVNVFIQTRALDVFARGAAQAVIAGTILSLLSLTVMAHFLT